MKYIKVSTSYTRLFLMVDSSDHFSKKTGLTPAVSLSKSGGAFASAAGSVSEVGNGFYKIQLNADDTNSPGDLAYHITASGADDTSFIDYVQLNTIEDIETNIRMIWNSIKNQGDFFSKIMDKFGLLEKNKGLVKQDIQEVVNSIKFPKQQEIKIPDFPKFPELPKIKDYSSDLSQLSESLKQIADELSSTKSSVNQKNTLKVEQMIKDLEAKIDSMPKYDSHFQNIQGLIQSTIEKASQSIKSEVKQDNSAVSTELKNRGDVMLSELRKLQNIFSRFDSLISKLNEFNSKLNELDSNDKSLKRDKESIQSEIRVLNTLVNTLTVIDRSPKVTEANFELLRSFGGKR